MNKTYSLLFACAVLSLIGAGCAGVLLAGGAAAGAGSIAFVQGELKTEEDIPISKVWMATIKTCGDMQFHIQEDNKDELTGRIYAIGSDDKKIYINLKSLSENATEIRIRINIFGDEVMSRRILSEIEKRL
ncbi:MAG: DUF3568 family protein [Candidatus Omnitrophota bacterium]